MSPATHAVAIGFDWPAMLRPRTVLTFARGILISAVHKLIATTALNLPLNAFSISETRVLLASTKSPFVSWFAWPNHPATQFAESNLMTKMQASPSSKSKRLTKSWTAVESGSPTFIRLFTQTVRIAFKECDVWIGWKFKLFTAVDL